MDRWRAFFDQADSDLWTIIHQAILLAAADYPAEFRDRRCSIAETLFARQPPQPLAEVTALSGSVITDVTAEAKSRIDHACRDEGNRHSHGQRVSKAEVNICPHSDINKVQGDRHVNSGTAELDTHMHSHDGSEVALCLPSGADSSVHKKVSMLKDKLTEASNQPEEETLRYLRELEHLRIDVEILKATDVGREVNKLRKHSSEQVRLMVKHLVKTWKCMVDEWANTTANVPALNAKWNEHGVGPSNPQSEAGSISTKMSMQTLKPLSHHAAGDSAGRSSDFGPRNGKLYSEHALEEMGSNRVESDEPDRIGIWEKTVEAHGRVPVFRNVKGQRISSQVFAVKSSSGAATRPMSGMLDVNRVSSGNLDLDQHRNLTERGVKGQTPQGELAYKKTSHIEQNSSAGHGMQPALDVSKRRPPIEGQALENAKRYRAM